MTDLSSSSALQFLEIEHKFLVPFDYDETVLLEKLKARGPSEAYTTEVSDTYYLTGSLPAGVFRHRIDSKLQELTFKSLAGDNEARTEVNLALDVRRGNQAAAIDAFLKPLGILWSGTLAKSVQVFYFKDVEVVFYRATYQQSFQACIEIEARRPSSLAEAHQVLERWESYLGLAARDRCKSSLLELLVLPALPSSLQESLRKVFN